MSRRLHQQIEDVCILVAMMEILSSRSVRKKGCSMRRGLWLVDAVSTRPVRE